MLYCIPRRVCAIGIPCQRPYLVAEALSAITSCWPSQVRPRRGRLAQKGSPLARLHSQECMCHRHSVPASISRRRYRRQITSCCPSHVRPRGEVSPEGKSPCSTAFPGVYVPSALRASVHISTPVGVDDNELLPIPRQAERGELAQKVSPLALLHSQARRCVPSIRSPPAPRPASPDSPSH